MHDGVLVQAVLLSALPRTPAGQPILNPWTYEERLGAMKSLIVTTTTHSPCLFEKDAANNVLWGLALQFGWQFRTGRLFADNLTLTPYSWWGDMNYQLMIVPLLGAMAAGYPDVPDVLVSKPPGTNGTLFCRQTTTPASPACAQVQTALDDWKAFFVFIQSAETACVRPLWSAALQPFSLHVRY